MSEAALSQIEKTIFELPVDEQLHLIARVAEKLRRMNTVGSDLESQLSAMAADEEIQRELIDIERDFRRTELDGLAG